MDLELVVLIVVLVLVGSHSLSAMGRYLPKRRKYSYLRYNEYDYKVPRMALVHFWIFVGSYILNFWVIWYWGTK